VQRAVRGENLDEVERAGLERAEVGLKQQAAFLHGDLVTWITAEDRRREAQFRWQVRRFLGRFGEQTAVAAASSLLGGPAWVRRRPASRLIPASPSTSTLRIR
jgi:hypothetical protein